MPGESLAYVWDVWDLLFPKDSPAALAINRLIVAFFLVGVLDALAAIGLLFRERRRIRQAASTLEAAGSRRPALSVEAIIKFLGVPSNSTVAQRAARALQLRTARMGGLQQTTSSHLDRYGLLARYVAGILTLIGLLGTVLGLSFALFKIQGALMGIDEVEKLQDLTEALGSTLSGMKTAFACTLAGLGTSLLLSLVNHAVRRFQISLAEQLDDFTFRGLLPFFEKLDPGADQATKAFVQKLQDSAEALDKVREAVTSAAGQYVAASTGFAGAVGKLEGIVSSFEKSVSRLADNQQGFTQTMAETRDAVRNLSWGSRRTAHGSRASPTSTAPPCAPPPMSWSTWGSIWEPCWRNRPWPTAPRAIASSSQPSRGSPIISSPCWRSTRASSKPSSRASSRS